MCQHLHHPLYATNHEEWFPKYSKNCRITKILEQFSLWPSRYNGWVEKNICEEFSNKWNPVYDNWKIDLSHRILSIQCFIEISFRISRKIKHCDINYILSHPPKSNKIRSFKPLYFSILSTLDLYSLSSYCCLLFSTWRLWLYSSSSYFSKRLEKNWFNLHFTLHIHIFLTDGKLALNVTVLPLGLMEDSVASIGLTTHFPRWHLWPDCLQSEEREQVTAAGQSVSFSESTCCNITGDCGSSGKRIPVGWHCPGSLL